MPPNKCTVQMAYLFSKIFFYERTDKRTNKRTDGPILLCPKFYFMKASGSVVNAKPLSPEFLFNQNYRNSPWTGYFQRVITQVQMVTDNFLTKCTTALHGNHFCEVLLKTAQPFLKNSVTDRQTQKQFHQPTELSR